MKYQFILSSALILFFIHLIFYLLSFWFGWSSLEYDLIKIGVIVIVGLILLFSYISENEKILSIDGFIKYYLTFILIFFMSSILNLSFKYTVHNYLDKSYKYEIAERSYQRMYDARSKRDLPIDERKSNREVEEMYSLKGLFHQGKSSYIINFIVTILGYIPLLLFLLLRTGFGENKSKHSMI